MSPDVKSSPLPTKRHSGCLAGIVASALSTCLACTGPNPFFHAGDNGAGGPGGAAGGTGPGDALMGDQGGGPIAGQGGVAGDGGQAPPDAPADDVNSPPVDLTSGLVGHWSLDGSAGQRMAADTSDLNNLGVLVNIDAAADWLQGRFGNALQFFGRGYVSVKASPSLDAVQNFTISAWVKPTDASDRLACVISRNTGSATDLYSLCLNHNKLAIRLAGDSSYPPNLIVNLSVQVNQWAHIAATFGGGTVRLYQDGVQAGVWSYPVTLPVTTASLLIGTGLDARGADPAFIGLIDEILFYSVVLPDKAIEALAQGAMP